MMAEGWHVARAYPTTVTDTAGRTVQVMRVDFTTDKGSMGYITMPLDAFSADKARELVAPAAAELVKIENL